MISSVVFACKFKWVTILIHLFLWLSYSYWLYWANYCPHAVWHCLFSIKLVCWVQRLSNMQVFLFHLVQGRNWFLCPCSLISPLMVKLVLLWTASTMLTPCIVLFAALNYYQHFIYSISWSLIQRPDPPGNKEQPEYFQIHWWVVHSYLQSLWYFYPMGCSLQSSKA